MRPIERKAEIRMPVTYADTQIMHMPITLGAKAPVSPQWRNTLRDLTGLCPQHHGEVGYLTIDARYVAPGQTHRAPRIHVDGVYAGSAGGGWGGGGGGWGSATTGMLTVSDAPGCRAWNVVTSAEACDKDGDCEHLRTTLGEGFILEPSVAYHMSGLCPHESLPQPGRRRAFIRLSMPSKAPWFEGYTPSPTGVQPTGPILPRRVQMDRVLTEDIVNNG